ncbi:MAG: DUF3137 domain-containing protein [Akkermansiaceae bacterium]
MKWDVDHALESLASETEALERVRQEILTMRAEGTKRIFITLGAALGVGLLITLLTKSPAWIIIGVIAAVTGLLVINHIYFGKGAARYRTMFKVGFIAKLVKKVEPTMNYVPEQGIPEAVFNESGLFGRSPDRYSCEDLIHGDIGDTSLMLSEVHAETRHTRTDSKGHTKTEWRTLFQGILFTADFHKEFRSPVTVMPDVAERHFGFLGKKLQKLGGNLQRMENPEFEKLFVVRGADAVETRYILTPAMQERLIALRKRVGDGLKTGFHDSNIWLAIPSSENWFEGDLKQAAGSREQTKELIFQLWSCFSIVEELDLNTRIWTKE